MREWSDKIMTRKLTLPRKKQRHPHLLGAFKSKGQVKTFLNIQGLRKLWLMNPIRKTYWVMVSKKIKKNQEEDTGYKSRSWQSHQ